eukprot:Sdes_comp18739_c0_seq1m9098
MGEIACANVLSDLYAMGVYECDSMLMLMGLSTAMDADTRGRVGALLAEGFVNQAVRFAHTVVTGGQTVLNPWVLIGGVATKIAASCQFILPNLALPGDVLVLTKPLGTQVAVNLQQWREEKSRSWDLVKSVFSERDVDAAFSVAVASMRHLNRNAAYLMRKYNCHGSTDVTGFGILGHASNLARFQARPVRFHIHTLPIIHGMDVCDELVQHRFRLLAGFSAETSGGLLVMIPKRFALSFIQELYDLDQQLFHPCIVGDVLPLEDPATQEPAFIDPFPLLKYV